MTAVSNDLLHLVNEEMLPALARFGFQVVESEAAESFDNAYVVLEAPVFRVRILRERGIVVLDVGPTTEPNTWFDSAVLMDYLGLSPAAGFHDHEARAVLQSIRAFLVSMMNELTARFSPSRLANTKRELNELRERRAAKRFGF